MKKLRLGLLSTSALVSALLGSACSDESGVPASTGGTPSGTAGAPPVTAGAGGGSAGTTAGGPAAAAGGAGAPASGGSTPGTAGSSSGGESSAAGSGSSAAGSSAAGSGGSAAGSGGSAAGSGGSAAGSGGSAAGSGGSAAGSGGSAGAGGPPSTEKFSFFVTSQASMVELAKKYDPTLEVGFGADFSYGETGAGAGLRGADKICAAVAAKGMPNNNKRWRAFLSATKGESGQPVNAISRIGSGPWYDRLGNLVAQNVAGLLSPRPTGGNTTVANDLPNEFGVPNHRPDPTMDQVDNHDTLTGSNTMGELASTDMGATCNDWTSKVGTTGIPRIGHSWPRSASNGRHWISDHNAGGCAPGINIFGQGGPMPGDRTVGAGGGYGGIYCFSLDP
jgi:hypothetical protein